MPHALRKRTVVGSIPTGGLFSNSTLNTPLQFCRDPEMWVIQKYSLRGSNPRPMAHKTIALTAELRELSDFSYMLLFLVRLH